MASANPVAGGEGIDGGGIDVRVRVEVEIPEPLVPREPCCFDAPHGGAPVAVVALGQQQFCEESLIAQLLLLRFRRSFIDDASGNDRW